MKWLNWPWKHRDILESKAKHYCSSLELRRLLFLLFICPIHGMGIHGWHWRGRGTPYHQLQDVWVFPFAFQKTLLVCSGDQTFNWKLPSVGCLDQQRGWHMIALDLRGWMDHLKFRSTFLMDGTLDPATNRFWEHVRVHHGRRFRESSRRQSSFWTLSSFPFKGCLTFH